MWRGTGTLVALLVAALCLGGGLSVCAQTESPPPGGGAVEPNAQPPAGGSQESSDEPVLVSFDEMVAEEKGDGIWELIGHVKMQQGDTTMTADYCEWNRNTNKALFTTRGNEKVKIVDPNNTLTCDRCDVDLDAETATLTGNVTVKSRNQKEAGQEDNPDTDPYEYGTWTTTCNTIFYDYGKDEGRAEGNVVSTSEDGEWKIRTELALYKVDENDVETITLPNNPKIESSDALENMTFEKVIITMPPEGKTKVQLIKGTGKIDPNKDHGSKGAAKPEAGAGSGEAPPPGGPNVAPGGGDGGSGFEGMPPEGGTEGGGGAGGGTGG